MKVELGELTLLEAFEALWTHCVPSDPFRAAIVQISKQQFDRKMAQEKLESGDWVDYWEGRPIKTVFKGNALDPTQYDRNTHPGAMERIIKQARLAKKEKSQLAAAHALTEQLHTHK